MKCVELMSRLRSHNVRLWAENGQLRYSAPKGVMTEDLLGEIRTQKHGLLELLESTSRFRRAVTLSPVDRTDTLPLSFAQERLWFLEHLFPDSQAYNSHLKMRLEGFLDIPALQKSLQAVVDRHESLRTCFPTIDDKPVQVINDDCPLLLSEHDLKSLPEAEGEIAAKNLIEEEILRPFDLTHGPVIRAALISMAVEEHILLITVHHIATDGWSRGIIQRDLAALYNAQVLQQTPTLPALPVQYVDFAHWQRQWLTGEVLEDQLRYWRTHLTGLSNLDLPTDRPRPPVQTHTGASHTFQLARSLARDLRALSRQAEVTLATTLLAAFQVLLARYTGQTDIAVGSPIANRPRLELENLVGFFVNTLVMRTDLSGDPSFREVLARVNEVAVGANEHQDLPFEQLVAELQPERDFSRNPLFQILFAFQNVPREAPAFQGLTIRPIGKEITTTRMDLECFVGEDKEELHVNLVFNAGLFDRATIERFGTHLRKVLTEVALDPALRLSEISLLDEAERHQLLAEWNTPRVEVPQACIHEVVESQVARTPAATAAEFEDQILTYQDLNTRANQLAHHLRSLGIGPGALVGISMHRSQEVIVGLLGVLKAGGAYVPLDPAYPAERLAFMAADSGVKVLLTQHSMVEALPPYQARVVCVDTDSETIAQGPTHTPVSETTAEDLAVVIYTSGSTGRPKGVALCHRTLTNLIEWQAKAQHSPRDSTTLQFASLSFDVSLQEIFSTLATGGRLLMVPESMRADFLQLLDVLDRHAVQRIFLPFVALQQLANVAEEHGRALYSLQEVITAGEQLKISESVARFMHHRPDGVLVNQYGPSESHVVSSYALSGSPEGWPTLPPIGHPIDSTQLYVLDARLEPVPIGAIGELYIGGTGLARGYLNQPEMTAEKFVPHPFSADPGARLYRTGDLARYRPDGNLEFLGRRDHQVKLRGYRIELGEIEALLSVHPSVHEAVAFVREEAPGDQRLVAYVVSPQGVTPGELRRHLQRSLPEYMVPAHFVMLDALPLTPTGKVDRKELPAPEESRASLEMAFVAPQTPTEEQLAKIWQEVLRLDQIGIQDNFFEFGGHSLLATQVLSRVYKAFEVEVPLRVFFDNPTIEGIADFLANAASATHPLVRPQLVPVPREGGLPLSFAQERLWLLDQLDPGDTAYTMPAAFRLSGPLDIPALEESLSRLLQRHEVLRTRYAFVEEEAVQVIAPGGDLSLPIVELDNNSPEEQESALRQKVLEEYTRPFDLGQGPLFRFTLIRLSPDEHALVLVLHHSVADGQSMDILYRELATGYEAARHGKAGQQGPLPVQYADYAVWQRQWLQGAALEALLSYWTEQLADAPHQLNLHTDFPRPAVQTHRGGHHAVELPESVVSSLRALSQSEGVTMFMSLLTAFALVLSRHTGQEDIMVGSPVANRPRPELEGMIGLFLNPLVLRTKLGGDPTFRELLRRVREVCLGAYAHQELPFEKLVEELQPERDLSRTPLFQVFLNLVDFSETSFSLPGLTVTRVGSSTETAKFDLTLYVFLTGTGAIVRWSYNRDLFDVNTIAWMAGHFQEVLTHLSESLDHPISSVSLLGKADRTRSVGRTDPVCTAEPFVAFPDTALAESIPARFEEQAHETPEQLAVQTARYEWTYEELNRRANQVAHTLLSKALPADARVALLCGQDAPMLATVLGVLKSGYTYVPLDPLSPPARLEAIVTDAGALAVLTESRFLPLARQLGEAAGQVLVLDEAFTRADTGNPQNQVSPDNLAYILYTSGTTGVPKGVMQSHRHVLHHIRVYTNNLHLSAEDRLTLLAPYGFDAAVMDLYGALLNGATLHPLDLRETDPATIPAWMARNAITIYHSTPTVYRYWTRTLEEVPALPSLRLIVLGGEVATRADFEAYLRHFDRNCLFVNGLGPTESTVSLQFVANHSTEIIGKTMPVGYPVEHTEVALLNQDGQETEVYGEIAIRSPYVAVGYWNRPELTRAAFDPPPQPGGARLYRTGDLGRRRFDGSLEFMGRKDTQVKIRGFRIEVREIEYVLGQHPAIGDVVVVPGEDSHGDKYLVAYLATDEAARPSISEIRGILQQKLPDYMIPSAFMFLDALPRTPNGKVNYRALPEPELERDRLETKFVGPRTQVEKVLAKIWGEVLGLERVGVHDNFFDLGGQSLLAVRLFTRIQKILGKDLPLTTLFQAPTIGQLASIIQQEGLATPWSSLVPIQPGGSKPPFFCVHGCSGRVLHFYDLAHLLGPEQPFYGLSALGSEKGQVPLTRIQDMAAHYINAIRTIQITGPYYLGASGFGCAIVLEMAHQLESQGQTVNLLALLTPSPLKPRKSSRTFSRYMKYAKGYYRLLIFHLKSRPLIPALYNAFSNRVLWHFRIFHRFIPVEIHRWRRFMAAFSKARRSYRPEPYSGRITCLVRDEFSHNLEKGVSDWYDIAVGELDVRFVPGNIFTMWKEPHVHLLADQLKASLDEAVTHSKEFTATTN